MLLPAGPGQSMLYLKNIVFGISSNVVFQMKEEKFDGDMIAFLCI